MWQLLSETMEVSWKHRAECVKFFWPLVFLVPLAIALVVFSLAFLEFNTDGGLSLILLLFPMVLAWLLSWCVGVASGAVRWHRLVIADEVADWRVRLPDKRSFVYALKLTGFALGYMIVVTTGEVIFVMLLMPALSNWLSLEGHGITVWYVFMSEYVPRQLNTLVHFASPPIGSLILLGMYIALFGRWQLTLPTGSLDSHQQVTKATSNSYSTGAFLGSLFVISSLPILFDGSAHYLLIRWQLSNAEETLWYLALQSGFALIVALLALTLLSVSYRRKLGSRQDLADARGRTSEWPG